MKKGFWNKRIPTLLGVLIITAGIGITTFLVNQGVIFITKASPTNEPKNVRVTNVTESSFTVSYRTDEAVIGSINYGDTNRFGETALDERDQQTGNLTEFKLHHLTVRNLSPGKKYYFSILSGGDSFLNKTKPFEITTGKVIDELPEEQEPIAGKAITPDGNAPVEAIVYVTSPGAQVVSTTTDTEGNYLIPLNSIRDQSLGSYQKFNNDSKINLLIIADGMESNISLSINQINPVPTVTLSNNYDFTSGIEPVASVSGQKQNFPSFESVGSTSPSVSITTPADDQAFVDSRPTFRGTALPNQTVTILIESNHEIRAEVKTDANGNWTFRPSSALAVGGHKITVTSNNSSGNAQTISQTFAINPSGSQVNESATPSGTLTPTLSPSPTPTLVASISPNLTLTPTEVSSPSPTELVSVTPIISDIPAPGNPSILAVGIIGIATTLLGVIFFILSRGSMHI